MKLTTDKKPATKSGLGQPFALGGQQHRKPPRNYFSRGEQVRLLMLCSMLMLILVMMNEARKPSNWDWLWAGEQTVAAAQPEEPIDTKIDPSDRSLPADAFTTEQSTLVDNVSELNAYLPEITPELLRPIRDNTVMRAAETEAWMTMLVALKGRSAQELENLSRGNVGFAQLFRQTDFYRGQLVTVSGTVRRLEAITPRENEHGIVQLYRWILRPKGSDAPVVIYSLEKPAALDVGDDLREACVFTGFCFKRWAYPAGDGTRVAPLLLAKAPQWTPPVPPATTVLPTTSQVALSIIALLAISSIIAFAVYRSANVVRPDIDRLRAAEAGMGDDLRREAVLPSTSEALRALEQSSDDQDPQ